MMEWARAPDDVRPAIDEIAGRLGRSIGSVQQFLRRVLPRGQWPWAERPRWTADEIAEAQNGAASLPTRSSAALKKYLSRHRHGDRTARRCGPRTRLSAHERGGARCHPTHGAQPHRGRPGRHLHRHADPAPRAGAMVPPLARRPAHGAWRRPRRIGRGVKKDATDSGFIATFADPDDNDFQLMSPMPAPD